MILASGKASGRQRREDISAGKRAEALPKVGPQEVARSQLAQMAKGQINMDGPEAHRRQRVQDEAGQRQRKAKSHGRLKEDGMPV
jgi:hypothetical protein